MQKKNFLVLALLGLFCIVYFWVVPAYEEKKNTKMEAKQIVDMKEELSQIWEGYKVAVKEPGTIVSKKEKIGESLVKVYDMTLNIENMEKTIRQGNRAEYTFLQQYIRHISSAIRGRFVVYGSQISGARPGIFQVDVDEMPYNEKMAEKFYRIAKGNTNNVGQNEKPLALPSNGATLGATASSSVPTSIGPQDMVIAGIKANANTIADVEKMLGVSWSSISKHQMQGPQGLEDTGLVIYNGYGLQITADRNNKGNVVQVVATSPTIKTQRGVKIGDSADRLVNIYGEPWSKSRSSQNDGTIWYRYSDSGGSPRLTFVVKDNIITSIVNSVLHFGP